MLNIERKYKEKEYGNVHAEKISLAKLVCQFTNPKGIHKKRREAMIQAKDTL